MPTPRHLNTPSPRINFQVTQDLIDTSTRKDSSHCMIADALQAAKPEAKYISVDLATIRFTDLAAGKRYIYLTPRGAQAALLDFDQGKKVEPFSIRLDGAHVLATGNANRARASLEPRTAVGGGTPPERRGGQSPPLGPLPGGAPRRRQGNDNEGAGAGNRTGRRREFGLRAIIR